MRRSKIKTSSIPPKKENRVAPRKGPARFKMAFVDPKREFASTIFSLGTTSLTSAWREGRKIPVKRATRELQKITQATSLYQIRDRIIGILNISHQTKIFLRFTNSPNGPPIRLPMVKKIRKHERKIPKLSLLLSVILKIKSMITVSVIKLPISEVEPEI